MKTICFILMIVISDLHMYRGFPEGCPVFSPPMGTYFTLAFIWC